MYPSRLCISLLYKRIRIMKKLFLSLALACVSEAISGQIISGTWNGELNAGVQKIPLVLNLTDDGKCTLDSPQQGAKRIPANVDFLSADSLKVSVSSLNASYAAHLENGELKGLFTQNGFKLPLNLKPGELAKANRPQTPQPPYPYETEEVTFTNDKAGATLAGTLTIPADAKCVLLMVTGSGAQNRDEEVFEHKPFAVIADRLARAGIATLRYDDRATGKSIGGMDANATTKDFAEDAVAGIEWLRTSDFIVSLAGPGVKGDTLLAAQNNRILSLNGQPATVTVEKYRQTIASLHNPWIQWFIDHDPSDDIHQTHCPVFALNGDRDCQVISSLNLPAIKRLLPASEKNLIKEYPSLNHLFQHSTTGLPTEYGTIEETFSEEAINDIIAWVKHLYL